MIANESIMRFSGRIAAQYLTQQTIKHHQEQQENHGLFGLSHGTLELPPDLELAKRSLMSTVSSLYAMLLIVVCSVCTSTEIITEKVSMDFFESCGFYTYLYSVSVAFMTYLFICVLRDKRKTGRKMSDDFDADDFIRRITQATGLDVKEVTPSPMDNDDERRRFSISFNQGEGIKRQREIKVKLMTSENDKSHGSLFLRIGAMAFGLGTLIYTGLEFLTFFEVPRNCMGWAILLGANPILYMVFVFMQMYYIFVHSRINVNKNKVVAKFGMMHVVATNVCIVIRTLVKESAKGIMDSEKKAEGKENGVVGHQTDEICPSIEIIGDTMENASVYLFPFIIEYSIIGSAVLFSMWKHIGKNPEYVVVGDDEVTKKHHQREPLDWSSSSYGLFMGLLSLVTSIITLIIYFALVNQDKYQLFAILINNVSDTVINFLMIFAMIYGFVRTRHLQFLGPEGNPDVIMFVTAFGVFVYNTFNVIAGALNTNSFEPGQLVVANGLAELIEVGIQLLFVADLSNKRVDENNPDEKPGRQVVTFLLITNLGLWITYNFEIQKGNATPDQSEFYGFLPWVVIQRLALPLCVFFRFHSTVVLAELWKNCYRIKRTN